MDVQAWYVRDLDCLANNAADPVTHAPPTEEHGKSRREQNKTQNCS